MTISVGQHTALANVSAQAGPFTSSSINTSATGSSFLIGLIVNAGTAPTGLSASDNKSNTYTLIGTSTTGFGGSSFALYQCTNGNGGTGHTGSINYSGSALPGIFFIEITGAVTTSLIDQLSSAQWNDDTSTPFTSNATAATTQANELCIAFTVTGSNTGTEVLNWTANGYTQIDSLANASTVTGATAFKNVTSIGTQQTSFTSSGAGTTECVVMLVTLKEASAPPPPVQTLEQPNRPRPGRGPFSKGRFYVADYTPYSIVNQTYNLSLTESGSAADAVSAAGVFGQSLTVSGSAADSSSSTGVLGQSITESGSAADSATTGSVFNQTLTESGSAADSITNNAVLNQSVSESGIAADVPSAALIAAVSITEAGSAAYSASVSSPASTMILPGFFLTPPPPPPDTTPPTDPTGLGVSLVSNVPVLSWTASTDNVLVVGYQIWRKTGSGGTYAQINTSPLTTYTDHTVSIGNTYFYKVSAYDSSANVSGFSNEVSQAVTGADVTAPNIPGQPSAATVVNTTNPPTYQTNWSAVSDIDPGDGSPVSGVKQYRVYHNGVQVGIVPQTGTVGSPASFNIGATGAVTGSDTGTVLSASGTGTADPHLDTTDERFLSVAPVQGAGSAVIKLTGFTNTTGGSFPKVGLELRNDLSASAAYCDLLYFGTNGLKGEQRTAAGGHAAGGASATDPGLTDLWFKLIWDVTWNVTRQYSTNSTNGTDGTWTTLDTIQMFFGTVAFIGKFAYPNISGTGTGTVSLTYSNFAVTGASPIVWNGTGIAGTTILVTVAAEDNAGNVSVQGTSRSVTFTSQAVGKAALRMANSWIGGSQISAYNTSTYQTYVSKCQGPILLNWQAGWDSPGISPHPMKDIMGSIKALAIAAGRTPPPCGLYYGYTYILPTGLDSKLYAAFNTNFWWLYSVYHSGSIQVNSQGNKLGNYTAGSQVDSATGFNASQWLAHYVPDWMVNGGVLGLATGPNVANPNIDFINSDDGYITLPPPSGDWNRTGTGTSGSDTAFRTAYIGLGNAIRTATGKMWTFNTSQCGSQLSGTFPEYVGQADIGFMDQMIGTYQTYEYNSSIANFILDYQRQSQAVKSGGDQVFGHYSIRQSDGTDGVTFDGSGNVTGRSPAWQGFRHCIAAMGVLGNACYYPSLTGQNDAGQTPIWPDCMAVNIANRQAYTYPNVDAGLGWTGPWVDPPQTAAWQNGVWRRRAQFATFYWNQRGNGTRTITGLTNQWHYLGVQNPSYDNGLAVTSLTFTDRDGAILCNQ